MARVVPIIVVVSAIAAMAWTAPTAAAATGHALAWPVDGALLKPFQNGDDPYAAGMHRGVDIAAPAGATVRAAVGGEITYAARLPDGALDVTVRSTDGRYLVSHMHLSSIAVRRGGVVRTGAVVGTVGSTGRPSSPEPHVHLGVRLADSRAYVDPLPLLPPRPAPAAPPSRPPGEQQTAQTRAPAQRPAARRPASVRMRSLVDGGQVRERTGSHRRLTQRTPADTRVGSRPVADRGQSTASDRSRHPSRATIAGRDVMAPGLSSTLSDGARRVSRERLTTGSAANSGRNDLRQAASTRTAERRIKPAVASGDSTARIGALVAMALVAAWLLWRGRRPAESLPRPTGSGRTLDQVRERNREALFGLESNRRSVPEPDSKSV